MEILPWSCRCGPRRSLSKNRGAPAPSPPGRRSKYTGQSVRAMPMRVLTVGKKRSRGTQLLVEEYKEKLGYYCDIEDTVIRSNPKHTSDVNGQVEAEDTAMMQQLKPEDFVIVLDVNGKDVISEHIADLIGDAGNTVEHICQNVFFKCFRDGRGSHFVLVGHMVLGYKCESVQMRHLGYPHWF